MKKKYKPYLFCMGAILLILIVVVFPICYTGYISFTNMSLYHWEDYKNIGFGNYIRALFKMDSGFLAALITTIIWTIVNMALQLIIGFFISLGLNTKGLRMKSIYKTLLMFPWAMPAYISILLWRVGVFNTEFGLFNKILGALGFKNIDFLATNGLAFISFLILNLWISLPFMIATIDGALQSVSSDYYESATLEGAGFWVKVWKITIPTIKPIIAPAAVMTTFVTFKQFDIIYLLTLQQGHKTGATLNTVITYAYQNAFASNNYGLSSAVSMIIFGLIILFSFLTNRALLEEK